jgi:hypothetical protein
MRRLFWGCAALILAAGFGASRAKADMDYRCLSICMNGGMTATACMAQCTYGQALPSSQPHSPAGQLSQSPHDQFAAPLPSDRIMLAPHASGTVPGKDYRCVSQCQRNGFQYQLCDERCTDRAVSSTLINTNRSITGTASPSILINAFPSVNKANDSVR